MSLRLPFGQYSISMHTLGTSRLPPTNLHRFVWSVSLQYLRLSLIFKPSRTSLRLLFGQYSISMHTFGSSILPPTNLHRFVWSVSLQYLRLSFMLKNPTEGAQWLSGRVLDSRLRDRGFKPHWRHCVVVLEQDTFILA